MALITRLMQFLTQIKVVLAVARICQLKANREAAPFQRMVKAVELYAIMARMAMRKRIMTSGMTMVRAIRMHMIGTIVGRNPVAVLAGR